MRASTRAGLIALVAAGVTVVYVTYPGRLVYWRSEGAVEDFLREQTPLGSSQETVLKWLRHEGVKPTVTTAFIPPNSEYPPTRVGGSSFINESLAHYWAPFPVDVEAFYIFDSDNRLADVRVRDDIDAL
jgi:hypothetical protein